MTGTALTLYLKDYDFDEPIIQIKFVLASLCLWLSIYLFSFFLSFILCDTFHKLRPKEKIFWNLTLVRGVFGVIGPCCAGWTFLYAEDLHKDIVNARNPLSNAILLLSIGFFIFEGLSVTISDCIYGKFQILLNLHHWLGLVDFLTAFYARQGHFFGCTILMLEISTPFSAICWTLIKCGYAETILWKLNQFFLLHAFHLRSVVEFYVFYKAYVNFNSVCTMPVGLIVLIFGSLALSAFIMTPYWTYKKTVQFCSGKDFNFEVPESMQNGHVISKKSD